jgi:acyl-CoA hydrolase/GNAT superfamily N-acetyltransferase
MAKDRQKANGRKKVTAVEAVRSIGRGKTIFIGTGCGEPQALVMALIAESENFGDNEIVQTLSLGLMPYDEERFTDRFRLNAFFIGPNVRYAVNDGRADYTPVNLSQLERMFNSGKIGIDVALIQVTPPDANGDCSLGVSVDITKSAAENAEMVIAQVNHNMPRTHGDSLINLSEIDYIVEIDEPLYEWRPEREEKMEVLTKIGKYLSDLVPDGATLQIGYGSTPDAAIKYLVNKKDLGVHTELLSDGLVSLIESGAVNGSKKTNDNGKVVASFVMGTQHVYDFVNENDIIEMRPSSYTNDPCIIGRQENMISINSAMQVDLTGQVCADQLGKKFFSGLGGHADFMRGAARSKGGKPIIAIPSTAQDGSVSRIMPTLETGSAVTTTRGDVHYVVTEYGIAELHGKSISQRALALISIAHPKFRPQLLAHAKSLGYVFQDVSGMTFTGSIYPEQYEAVLLIKGVEVYFRPAKLTDEAMIKEMFYSLSETTMYQRYMGPKKQMPHSEIQRLIDIDYEGTMTVIAMTKEDEHFHVIGMASYDVDKESNTAEVAFVVVDRWQNKGVGMQFMDMLIKIAQDKGIRALTAELLSENFRMLDMFYRTGLKVEARLVEDTYMINMDLWSK